MSNITTEMSHTADNESNRKGRTIPHGRNGMKIFFITTQCTKLYHADTQNYNCENRFKFYKKPQ